ncbi:hypothetical protein [Oscillatoria sp. FACHB-1406]|uniref:hypothetical protein n=1 Tax=Oscillatoria sp. FACHB-1406 TaxID=2692846 RepID=UPI0016823AB6|nr:hypothetical protein [Oscillatoria sp. FACHB-1406]MBD2580625.1 hypothetical protein [Oscillatoria sp. FACHB-1406]
MLSLLLMFLYNRSSGKKRYIYLVLSAFLFVFALEVKLSGLIALPTLVAIGASGRQQWRDKVRDAVIWILTSIIIFALFSTTIFPFSYYHLILLHSGAGDKFESTDPSLTLSTLLLTGFKEDTVPALLALFIIGSLFAYRKKNQFIPPLLLLSFNLLRFYKALPVWPNYYIHLAIPIAWLIGLTLARFNLPSTLSRIRAGSVDLKKLLLPGLMLLAIFGQLTFNIFKIVTATQPRRYQNAALVAANVKAKKYRSSPAEEILKNYQGTHKIILTDNPYFIHKFELDTPPETAILSRKRVIAENLDGDFILKVIQKRKPDFVLLDRFPDLFLKSKALSDFLQENYSEYSLKNSQSRFFIAKTSKASP